MDRTSLTFDGKALSSTELEDGSMLLEGFAIVFAGLDRTLENFAPGCLARTCKSFLEGSAPLCYHHRTGDVLGKVLELVEVPGVGVRFKARVDGAIKNHPTLGTLYHQIKNGTLTGASLAGFFKRVGNKIVDVDATELSITGVPCHSQPAFAVVEGKAWQLASVEYDRQNLEWLRGSATGTRERAGRPDLHRGPHTPRHSLSLAEPQQRPQSLGKKPHFARILLSDATSRRFTGLGSPTRAGGYEGRGAGRAAINLCP
jgi:hypothetical protein